MNFTVTEKKQEPLLSRTMLKAKIEFEKTTPSYSEVSSAIASHLKVDEKMIAIRHVYGTFGARKADVTAYIYEDEAKKQFVEPKLKVKKDKKAKEAPKKE